jgi:serine/threonine protein kinase
MKVALKLIDLVEQLHSSGVVHRDIKMENILIKSDKNDSEGTKVFLKIADFGLTRI